MDMMEIGARQSSLLFFSRYSLMVLSVSIRVGTPPQWTNVFVSTASQETWMIGVGGCDGSKYKISSEFVNTPSRGHSLRFVTANRLQYNLEIQHIRPVKLD